jgi:hypothetical protein
MSISVHRTSRSTLIAIAIVLGVIVVAFIAAELLYAIVPPGPALPQGHLTDAQSKALDVMLKLCDSFITWAVATIGGVALLLRFSIEKKLPYTRGDVVLAAGSMLSAGVSVFCGHLAMDLTKRALSVNQFPGTVEPVHQFLRFQYLFGLAGIGLLALFSLNYFLSHAKES